MNPNSTHYAGQDALRYKNTDSDPFERIAQPVPRLPILPSPQSLSLSSPWHTPPETGSALDVSATGYNPPLAYTSMARDYSRSGDHYYGWGFPELARGYEAHVPNHPFDFRIPFAPPQFNTGPRGTLDQLIPSIRAYEIIYTDDASMKLGNGVRRRCFNCGITETTTWRRSAISHGKLLCNKCGLYERTHSTARPKEFPRRRRSRLRLAPTFPDMYYPHCNLAEHRHHDDSQLSMSLPLQFPNALGSVSGGTTPQQTSLIGHTGNMPSVPSTLNPSHVRPCFTDTVTAAQLPTPYHATFR